MQALTSTLRHAQNDMRLQVGQDSRATFSYSGSTVHIALHNHKHTPLPRETTIGLDALVGKNENLILVYSQLIYYHYWAARRLPLML